MSAFETKSPPKRISLTTVYLRPNQTLDLFVRGWVSGLSVGSTDDNAVTVSKPLAPDGSCTIKGVSPNQLQVPRIELVMQGQGVWDYFEVSVSAGTLPAGWGQQHNYIDPGHHTVRVTAYWAKSATPNTFARSVDVARLILENHGMKLSVKPGPLPDPSHQLPFNGEVSSGSDIIELRKQVDTLNPESDRQVVIVAPCASHLAGAGDDQGTPYGWTFHGDYAGGTWSDDYIVINSSNWSPTGVTLLHEIGHAAGLGHTYGGVNAAVANFMNEPLYQVFKSPGTDMLISQVQALAGALFAR
jgi:hypothetical protein